MCEQIDIIRSWKSKTEDFMFGTDKDGALYCRDLKLGVNLILIDAYYKSGNKYYYKFIYPESNKIKLVLRQ